MLEPMEDQPAEPPSRAAKSRRRSIARRLLPLAAAMATTIAAGCSSSVWKEAYRPSPLAIDAGEVRYPREHPVMVREAPWDRVQGALKELSEQESASDVHVSEWTADQRLAATERLLTALQLSDPPESVTILGSSAFRTTDNVRPDDGTLARLARQLGADYAIWSSRYAGRGTKVVDRPVTVHNHGWTRYYDRHDHVWRDGYFSDVDTAWVPVVVDADRYAFVAFFVRKEGSTALNP